MRTRVAAIAVLLITSLAGCTDEPQPTPTPSTPPLPGGPACDTQAAAQRDDTSLDAAYEWMTDIVYTPDGELRPRHPTHPGHACTADWLEASLMVDGWEVGRQDFSGAEYDDLEHGGAASWRHSCPSEDKAELPDLALANLWAKREGGDKTLLLAAHWDAKEDADDASHVVPAANDGASGMGVLLALQRHIAANDILFPFDIVIAFFDAEDGFADCHPLAGSLYFAQHPPMAIDRMILLDMVGDADARFPREGNSEDADPALVDLIWSKADANGLGDNFIETRKSVVDDHLPFIEQGIPAVDIIDYGRVDGRSGFPPYWHTTGDTPDKLSAETMSRMGHLVLDVMQDARFVLEWPSTA